MIVKRLSVIWLTFFQKLNLLNKELQGNNSTLLTCKTKTIGFIAKLDLYRLQITAANFEQFPNVAKCAPISHAATDVLLHHIFGLITNFNDGFIDLRQLNVPRWVTQQLITLLADVEMPPQEEITDMHDDDADQSLFKCK